MGFPYLVACNNSMQGTRRASSETGVRGHLKDAPFLSMPYPLSND